MLCDLSVTSALRSDFTHDGSYGNRGFGRASLFGARQYNRYASVTNKQTKNSTIAKVTHVPSQLMYAPLSQCYLLFL